MPVPGQHPNIARLADRLATEEHGWTTAEAIKSGLCINCKKEAGPRCYSEAGRKEYRISGLCEWCFDEAFEEQEDTAIDIDKELFL